MTLAELPAELLRREIAAVLRATRIGHGAGKCFDTVSPTEVDAEADRVVRIEWFNFYAFWTDQGASA